MDPKSVEAFEVLKKLMSSDGNFEAFRTALHSESPPSIPYLGMYLTDLTFIEDGNPGNITLLSLSSSHTHPLSLR